MASLLKTWRGNGEQLDAVRDEIRQLATQIHSEKEGLEQLLSRARKSSKELAGITEPVARMSERLGVLERQMGAIEGRVPAIVTVQDRAAGLLDGYRRLETQMGDAGSELARIKSEIDELGALVQSANALKRDIGELLAGEGTFRTLHMQASEMKARMADLSDEHGRLRQRQDDVAQASKDAAARVEGIETASRLATVTVQDARRRVESIEQTVGRLTQFAAGAGDMKHQLLTLKSLADQVTQKAAALENQRDAVERAAREASRLDDLVHKVDAAIRQQEGQMSDLHALATDVGDLRSLYESVAMRSQEIRDQQQRIEDQGRESDQKLDDLGDRLRRAAERFDLEHRGLETVNLRITDLRSALRDCEERMSGLDASSRAVTELQAQANDASTRIDVLTDEVAKLDDQPERIRLLRAEAQRLHDLVQDVSKRAARIEEAKPVVDDVVRDLATLGGTHEAIRDAAERMRLTGSEIARMREDQARATAWLEATRESLTDLQERVRELDAARPTVETVQKDVARVVTAMDVVAERRQFVEEMQARLAELAALGAQLDDRTKAFRSRLDIAESRFVSVTKQAEETERIARLVVRVSGTVTDANDRIAGMTRSIAMLEGRSQNLEELAERTRLLGLEIDVRQRALDRAAEQLERASQLRQESADAVQQLDERMRVLQDALGTVEERATHLQSLSGALEVSAGKLRSIDKGVARFEEHLGKVELAKGHLERSLEQVASRQPTVDALRADIGKMFEVVERTTNDLRAAGQAQRDIRESKASLDDVLQRLQNAHAVTADLELREREIEDAERRLGRAEGLVIHIQSSLETLNNQKAMLDHVIEQAGALGFQVQQAEVVIERLRKERDITIAIRTGREDAGPAAGAGGERRVRGGK